MRSNLLARAAACASIALLAACGGDGGGGGGGITNPPPATVASVSVTGPASRVVAGSQLQLTATPATSAGTPVAGKTPTWTSGNTAVATVSADGMVSGVAPGVARITATVDGVSGGMDVTVRAVLATVQVTPATVTLAPGESRQLAAAGLAAGGAPIEGTGAVTWSSANQAVATVSPTGVVTAVAGGTVEIRATIEGVTGTATVAVATPVPTNLRFSTVAAGGRHACGLTAAGVAYCWGMNQSGALGAGSTDNCTPNGAPTACSFVPVAVSGGLRFSAITVATENPATCAVATNGRPYCWGSNGYAQLGNESVLGNAPTPTAVAVPAGMTFTQVVTGDRHACALAADGTAYCWGSNHYGQVGSGSPFADDVKTPALVATAERFTTLAAGGGHTCGLTAAGKAFCWGAWGGGPSARAPVAAAQAYTFTRIAAGGSLFSDSHTCGLAQDGRAFCWGSNGSGQLGIDPAVRNATPTPMEGLGGLTYTDVWAGAGYTCGLRAGGALHCFGRNSLGERGPGNPVPGTYRSASLGWFTCAIGTDGLTYCWGANDVGQLGTRTTEQCQVQPGSPVVFCSRQPVRVSGQD